MKATNSLYNDQGLTGAWAKLSQALLFNPLQRGVASERLPRRRVARTTGFFARLDRWFWRQTQREREAYLAGARDVYELEERIRRLERSAYRWFD